MALRKGLRPLQVLAVILFVRLLSVFCVKTWFVPDEYWQSLEVAHKQVFGYGALTWEWQKGIRSYLYPSGFAIFYYLLKITGLDHPDVLIFLPRILQALLSTAADYSFYKWTGGRKWALFLLITSWFWFYTSGRTLLQTTETALVTIALSMFPFKYDLRSKYGKENYNWCWFACICVFLRPTSAPLWIVLGVYNILTTNEGRLKVVLKRYIPAILITSVALIALDSYFYGRITFTVWEFFKFNVLYDVASFYGKHPWHWYLTQGLPAVLGVSLIPVLYAIYTILRRPKENAVGLILVLAIIIHVAVHSFIPHKEFRFVLPLLPIFLYLAQDVLVRWSRKAKKWQLYGAASVILLSNIIPAIYFGWIHQAGTVGVMSVLRENIPNNRTEVFFAMPCHSTPFYSHLHVNVSARYLHCEPPFDKIGEGTEAERFYNNPARWWKAEFSNKITPEFVVMFHKLKPRIDSVITNYKVLRELDHTQFPEGEVSEKVLVLKRTTLKPATPDQTV